MAFAWRLSFGALLLAAALLAAPGVRAQKVTLLGSPWVSFSFHELRTRDHADSLVNLQQLVKIYLWPIELGGEESAANIVYVTPEAAEARAAIVGDLRRFVLVANENEVEFLPEYRGGSIVPSRIRFIARHKRGGPKFERILEVWHGSMPVSLDGEPAGNGPSRAVSGVSLVLDSLGLAHAIDDQDIQYMTRAPDFSTVTSKAVAEKLVGEGELVKTWFFPTELGGRPDPENVAYITPQAAQNRAALIGKLRGLVDRDVVDRMDVDAEYRGTSIVPIRIRFLAKHSRGGVVVEETVIVW